MNQPADAVGLPVKPLTLVERAINPNLTSLSFSLSKILLPLAYVDRSVLESERTFGHQDCTTVGNLRDEEGALFPISLINLLVS